jgi:single-strand DNA-binding protein
MTIYGTVEITIVGDIEWGPKLRTTKSGLSVVNFGIRTGRDFRPVQSDPQDADDDGQLSLTCTAWRRLAENIDACFTRGMRVIVRGRFTERTYEGGDGVKRTSWELVASDAGPSLRDAEAVVTRHPRDNVDQAAAVPGEANGGRRNRIQW